MLCLDSGGGDQVNTVSLPVNLQGAAAPVLTFWWVRWLDSCDAEDGVLFSDNGGVSYTKVASLCNGTAGAWQKATLQIATLATAKGLKLNGSFVIRLQQRGSEALTKQGICFDDLGVSN